MTNQSLQLQLPKIGTSENNWLYWSFNWYNYEFIYQYQESD